MSIFDQTIIHGIDNTGAHRVMALLWWEDGRFGTDAGVYRQGDESEKSNFALDR